MLIRFELSNFRSILDPAELSMVAMDEDREEVRAEERLGHSLVTTAGVFGPNASGKSSVLAGLGWLSDAVTDSWRLWDDAIPVQPFAFAAGGTQPTTFRVEMTINEVRFDYVLELDSSRVRYEALFHFPERRRRRLFERDGDSFFLQRGLGELSGTRALLTERSLALSIMHRFDEAHTSAFASALRGIVSVGRPLNRYRRPPSVDMPQTINFFDTRARGQLELQLDLMNVERQQSRRERAMSLLQLADLGIADVEIDETKIESQGAEVTRRRPKLVHTSANERLAFDLVEESAGTVAWFSLIGPLLRAIERGSIVLFDELDASLHPTLTAKLLQLFHGRKSNPNRAQLIFTAHDTNLLNVLNRDEIWLTEKDDDGRTHLGALSDFAGETVRRSRNLERSYLSGRFGALPDVSKPDVLRELGLIG